MHHNVSVQLLKRISPEEFKALKAFIRKKVSDDNQENLLFGYLGKYHPTFEGPNLAAGYILKNLLKKEDNVKQRKVLSNIGHKLSNLIRDFLIDLELQNNELEKEFLLGLAYSRLGLHDLLDKLIEERSEKKQAIDLNIWYNWHLHRLHYLRYYSRSTIKTATNEKHLPESMRQLDLANLAAKLRIAHEMELLKRISGQKPSFVFSSEELQAIKQQLPHFNLYIQLYYYAYEIAVNPSDTSFCQLKKLLAESSGSLSKDEHGNLLNALINYASFAIKRGDDQFYAEAAELLKEGLESKVLVQDDKISPEILLNIINLTCEAEQIEAAKDLLSTWQSFLPHNLKAEAIAVLTARLNFYGKKFDEVSSQFSTIKRFLNHMMELTARITVIQANYESGADHGLLAANCETFYVLLRRNEDRFSEQNKESFSNFCKMVIAISKAKVNPNKKKLRKKLDTYAHLVCKKWLLEKIKALKE